jgi:hypothetical protein
MVIVSPTTMSSVVTCISGCGPLSQVSQVSQPEITLPVTTPLECQHVCPNVPTVPTVTTIHHVSPQQSKIPLHHARHLQAFDPCASANPRTTLSISGCASSFGVQERVWELSLRLPRKNDARPLHSLHPLHLLHYAYALLAPFQLVVLFLR